MADLGKEPGGGDPVALRAEHDALAERLRIRRSVDELRRAAYAGFAAAISLGLTFKFAWDRWGVSRIPRPAPRGRVPVLFLLALVVFSAVGAVAVRAWRRSRAHAAEEDRLFARLRELRGTLGLDS